MEGKIIAIAHQRGSGLAELILGCPYPEDVEDEARDELEVVPADAGPLFRSLRDCFGSVDKAIGQNIEYETDSVGVLRQWCLPEDCDQ